MVSRGFTSREFASRSPFAIKFANPSDTMSACAPPFSIQGFPTFVGHMSSYCCAKNFDIVKMNFFTFLSWRIITYILTTAYSFFDNISHTFKKKKATTPCFVFESLYFSDFWALVHLYRSDFFNSLPISLTEWPENRKTGCLSSRALKNKQCRPSFSWSSRENKRKRQKKKNKNRKPTKWAGKVWREKTRVRAHLGQNFKNIIISSNLSLKLL